MPWLAFLDMNLRMEPKTTKAGNRYFFMDVDQPFTLEEIDAMFEKFGRGKEYQMWPRVIVHRGNPLKVPREVRLRMAELTPKNLGVQVPIAIVIDNFALVAVVRFSMAVASFAVSPTITIVGDLPAGEAFIDKVGPAWAESVKAGTYKKYD
jgi:hypothetical protein